MPAIEFVTQSNMDSDNRAATTERLVNFYPEPMPQGSRARFSLKSVLGSELWANTGGVFIRDMEVVPDALNNDRVFIAFGGTLSEVDQSGSISTLGAIDDSIDTAISSNSGNIAVSSGGKYKVWDGTLITEPTAGAFTSIGSVEHLKGYSVLTEKNGKKIQWSALADAKTLPGLNFATAEARDDVIIRGVAINGNYWIFKTGSIEIWQVTGLANENAFAAIPGLVIEGGLRAFNLLAKFRDGVFYIGSDNIPYVASGNTVRPIGHLGVQTALELDDPTHCSYYEDGGHKFLSIRFSNRPAWVFDLATGLWHERATGDDMAWTAIAMVKAWGSWHTAGSDGLLRNMVRTNADVEGALIRRAISQEVYNGGKLFRVAKVEIVGRVGRSDIGREARVGFRRTVNGGNTFGALVERDMGALGEYDQRMVFRPLGQARTFAAEIRISDPAELTLYSSANVVIA